MAKARAIVKRRKAVRNIRKITRTMQMIATLAIRVREQTGDAHLVHELQSAGMQLLDRQVRDRWDKEMKRISPPSP